MGNYNELKQADYDADKLPKTKHSTKGLGKSEPDRKEWVTLDDGILNLRFITVLNSLIIL